MKYVWVADSASIKQEREIEKFDWARKLEKYIKRVRQYMEENLVSPDITRRKLATICYLIDNLKMRVGDEKDEDEADTVGVTTLRKDHVKIDDSGRVEFDFLGKDSVRWHKIISPPAQVVDNLRDFVNRAESLIFEGVRSEDVNAFLGQIMPGLTAKVFRTYHASKIVDDHLRKAKVKPDAIDLEKQYVAKMANLQAAIECNHKRKLPKNWKKSFEKKVERLKALQEKLKEVKKLPPSRSRSRRIESLQRRITAAKIRVELARSTKDYNLGTSLKSYIDPRIYLEWSKKVSYDWKKIYPKTLQRKFAWASPENTPENS
jgi:DNA topoisomerase-1